MEEEILLKVTRRADIQNRFQLPKHLIEKFGRDYYLIVYKDYFKIVPIKKEK